MFLQLRKQAMGLGFGIRLAAGIAMVAGSADVALGWQFRDLDETPTTQTAEVNLVPTNEEFLAPIVNAADYQEVKVEPPRPKVSIVKKRQEERPPAPEPEPAENLEPVPMPELVEVDAVKEVVPVSKPAAAAQSLGAVSRPAGGETAETDFHATRFREVQPAQTSLAQLLELWGEPTQKVEHADQSTSLIFHDDQVKQIEVTVRANVVTTILVHVLQPTTVETAEDEFALTDFVAVPIPDEFGDVLGQAYPERGLMLSFQEGAADDKVSAVLLEDVSAEMFRLRAEFDFDHSYSRSLADLEVAIRLDPKDAEAYWLQAQYLDAVGKTRDAIKSAQKAIRLKPTNAMYRLTRARLYAKNNRLQNALDEVRAVIGEIEMPNDIAAKAHNLLGDLLAIGADADHHAALKHHLQAIDLASAAVDDEQFAIRRRSKQVLVGAHLSVARDIAMGNFQRQSEVIPKWLLRAAEMADEFIADDNGDELIQLHVFRETLAAYAEIQINNIDAAVATEEAIETSREMISDASDELYKMHVERILAESLYHAARINRSRAKYAEAMQHANNAIALLADTKDQWDISPHGEFLQSQLYFVLGSLHAMKDEDHAQAVEWYAKARSAIIASNTVSPLYSIRGHGEMYVSMGLSYWEIGEQDKAIQITQTGTELMSEAVEKGSLQLQSMAVPYGNLAIMHSKMGRTDKSQEYTKLVAKVEKLNQDDTIRK